ncbi:MAG: hypothetical protein WBO06_06580 [Gammaproteobacteria bacterium]
MKKEIGGYLELCLQEYAFSESGSSVTQYANLVTDTRHLDGRDIPDTEAENPGTPKYKH